MLSQRSERSKLNDVITIAVSAQIVLFAALLPHQEKAFAADLVVSNKETCEALPAGANPVWVAPDTCRIDGTLEFAGTNTLTISSGIEVHFNGIIANSGTLSISGFVHNLALMNNSGTLSLTDTVNFGTITNSGTLNTIGLNFLNVGTLSNTGNLNIHHLIQSTGSVNNNNGGFLTVIGGGTIVNVGGFDNKGTLTNTGSIESIGLFNNLGGTLINNDGGSIFIHTLDTTSTTLPSQFGDLPFVNNGLFANLGGTLINNDGGSITIRDGGELSISFGSISENNGFIAVDNGGSINNPGGTINNNDGGTITVNSGGTLQNTKDGTMTNTGTINNIGTLTNDADSLAFTNAGNINNNATIANFGTIDNNPGGTITNNPGGTINNSGPLTSSGTITNNNGTITNTDILTNSGNVTNSGGIFTNNNNGLITNTNTGNITNFGTLTNINDEEVLVKMGLLNNFGTITNQGTITDIVLSTVTSTGSITNTGKVTAGFSFMNDGTFTNDAAGNLTIPSSGIFVNNGVLTNRGSLFLLETEPNFWGTLTNLGTAYNIGVIENKFGQIFNIGLFTNNGTITNENKFEILSSATLENNGTLTLTSTLLNGGLLNNYCAGVFDPAKITGNAAVDACAPIAADQSPSIDEDVISLITITGSNPEVAGNPFKSQQLTFFVQTKPAHGTLLLIGYNTTTSAGLTYLPEENFFGSDIFTFVANDGTNDSAPATVTITVDAVDDPPVADAGADRTVIIGELVTLDGTGSFDPESTIASFAWSQTGGPDTVTLNGADTATPTFIATTFGNFTFSLVVTDGEHGLESDADTVNITVRAPTLYELQVSDIPGSSNGTSINTDVIVGIQNLNINLYFGSPTTDDGEIVTTVYDKDDLVNLLEQILELGSYGLNLPEGSEVFLSSNDGSLYPITGPIVSVIAENLSLPPLTPVTVSFNYDDTGLDKEQEEQIRLLHLHDGSIKWQVLENTDPNVNGGLEVDTENNIVYGTVTAFSFFAPAIVTPPPQDDGGGNAGIGGGGGGGGGRSVVLTWPPAATQPDSYFEENPLAKIQISSASFLNAASASVNEARAGQQISIAGTFTNHQQKSQTYAFIVQVTDEDGIVTDLMWQAGTLGAGSTTDVSNSWTPQAPGIYKVTIFVWDGLGSAPTPLSQVATMEIKVT